MSGYHYNRNTDAFKADNTNIVHIDDYNNCVSTTYCSMAKSKFGSNAEYDSVMIGGKYYPVKLRCVEKGIDIIYLIHPKQLNIPYVAEKYPAFITYPRWLDDEYKGQLCGTIKITYLDLCDEDSTMHNISEVNFNDLPVSTFTLNAICHKDGPKYTALMLKAPLQVTKINDILTLYTKKTEQNYMIKSIHETYIYASPLGLKDKNVEMWFERNHLNKLVTVKIGNNTYRLNYMNGC